MNINAYIAALEGKKFCCWCSFKCNNAKVKGDTGDGQARAGGGAFSGALGGRGSGGRGCRSWGHFSFSDAVSVGSFTK